MFIQNLLFNISIFSLLVSVAIVARIFYFSMRPVKQASIVGGCYAGMLSLILMNLSVPLNENAMLDLRYAPLILSFGYFGMTPGIVTATFVLVGELLFSKNAQIDTAVFLLSVSLFIVALFIVKQRHQRLLLLFVAHISSYCAIHWLLVGDHALPLIIFHMVFLLFGLAIGGWLMEGYSALYTMMRRLSELNDTLKESQQELRETIRGQHGVIFKYKKSKEGFKITLCDGQLIRQNQLNPEVFLSPDWIKLIPPQSVEPTLHHFEKAWRGEETSYECSWPGGKVYFVMLQPTFRSGEVIEVVGSVIDITEKRRMEQALEESERHYRLIAENTSDLIAVMQANGKMNYLSPSHLSVLGYSPDELLEGGVSAIFDSQVLYRIQQKLAKIILNKKPGQLEFQCRHKQGNWVRLESQCMPVIGTSNDVEYIVIVSRDISERKKAEELALVSEKLAVVGELAAGVAHEIRNPLTTLKGFIQMFKMGEVNPAYLDVIGAELEQIERITNEFLILAKPQVVQYQEESIISILDNVIRIMTPQMNLNNIQVHTHYERELPFIYGEPNQLKQVFVNLFKNAMEAMPNGGTIKLRAFAAGDEATVEVEDNGCGIDPQLISRLGEPFYTLKEKGTGLGLMVCKKIMKEHNGTLRFQSELNQGTVARISLPFASRGSREREVGGNDAYLE